MRRMTISGRLRAEVENCGQSRYRIAQETGVAEAALSRFISGERGLALDSVDKLAAYFGLELMPVKQRRKGR